MTSYVALLRTVNVAGNNRVAMPKLIEVLNTLGFAGAQALLQTGNLVFQADGRSSAELEQLLPGSVEALRAAIPGRERVQADGKQLCIVYPDGIGRSKLTNTFIERRLGTRGTGHNGNTMCTLAALLQP